MLSNKISIVGIQTTPTKDKEKNLKQALDLVDEALALYQHVDMIVLPEYFYYAPDNCEAQTVQQYPQEVIDAFEMRARVFNTYIIAGTVAHRKKDGKIYNTALLFDREGKVVASYDKIHLFDALNAMGGEQESDMVTPGNKLCIYETDFGKIGIMVCYDIRFPEMARTLALQGVNYLFVPAAFYMPRFDHWQDILRTTALHNSIYVMGVNLFGKLDDDNIFCGRSIIADPWGVAAATAADKEGFIQAYVDREYSKTIRDSVGSFHNRVPAVYEIK